MSTINIKWLQNGLKDFEKVLGGKILLNFNLEDGHLTSHEMILSLN